MDQYICLRLKEKKPQEKYSCLCPIWFLYVETGQGPLIGNLLFTFRFSAAPHMQICDHVGLSPGLLGECEQK